MKALHCINSFLEGVGKNIIDFCLVDFDLTVNDDNIFETMISEEKTNINFQSDIHYNESLNKEQQNAYDIILDCVLNDKNGMFFIDDPGGTGKTYLYKALLFGVRSRNLIALSTALSGVAESLLPAGRTGHSRFKISLEVSCDMRYSVSKQSVLGKLLALSRLIIWDEIPMVHKYAFEALDKMLRNVTGCQLSFGGKVVCGRDFRQVLPVVQRRTKDIMKASLVSSHLWPSFTQLALTENMRAKLDPSFCEYLLKIGNGIERTHSCQMITFPEDITIHFEDEFKSLKELIDIVFFNFQTYGDNLHIIMSRIILTPKNEYADLINNMLLKEIPREKNVILAEIGIGEYCGKQLFLPRIPFIPLEGDKQSVPFKRTQFLIRLCFAMTINKSQGQTLDFVGLYLPESVFFHGQFCVVVRYCVVLNTNTIGEVDI
ncbi:uncharacterized protein LOC111370210 [Olea europaea var. sylvestris]|uniref:uncharacterized protein LOC111370210 n=1 Tax=Olea europaea var. sylvestris TaxID=158386 RepID=UPI000C1D34B2|nr:uncharacterized protein LOC111370210 [Olea europaea var. sylvestris]